MARPGLFPAQRPIRDGVAIIRQAWREGRAGFAGRRYHLPDLPFEPRPAPGAPIRSGAVGERAVDRAVRLADGLVVYVSRPVDVAVRYEMVTGALRRHGRERADFPFAVTTVIHVATDAEVAWREAAPGIAYLGSALQAGAGQGEAPRAEDLDPGGYLVGSLSYRLWWFTLP